MAETIQRLLCAILVCSCGARACGGADALPRVARFHGGKRAAVSFTFDDGSANQVGCAMPMLEQHGFRGTFFLVAGRVPDETAPAAPGPTWAAWRAAAERGHEIGNHSMTHANLVKVSDGAKLTNEIVRSSQLIEEKIGAPPVSFAYPFCAADARVTAIAMSCHVVVRGYKPLYGGGDFSAGKANAWIDAAISNGTWHTALLHGVGQEKAYRPIGLAALREHLSHVAELGHDLWVATYGEVGRYTAARDAAQVTVLKQGDNELTFAVTLDPHTDRLSGVPLTVIIPAPSHRGGTSSAVDEDGATIPISRSGDAFLLEAKPNGTSVTVRWKDTD